MERLSKEAISVIESRVSNASKKLMSFGSYKKLYAFNHMELGYEGAQAFKQFCLSIIMCNTDITEYDFLTEIKNFVLNR